jgi:hypothetical protein
MNDGLVNKKEQEHFEKVRPQTTSEISGRMVCINNLLVDGKIERIEFNMNGNINIITKKEEWMEEQPNTKIPAKKNKMITHAPVCK